MKKLVLLGVSAVLLTACSSGDAVKQYDTNDGYLVECVKSSVGMSCDWEHQVKK